MLRLLPDLWLLDLEDVGIKLFQNVGDCLPVGTAWHPRKAVARKP